MSPEIPISLRKDYEECQKLASRHYENFPVASLLMPKASRPHIASLYAFARTADDFADEDRFEGKRITLLSRWGKELKGALAGRKASPILRAFAHTMKVIHIPIRLPFQLLEAFRMDVTIHRYKNWDSVLYYCRHSANPVGRMVLYIAGIRDEKLHRYSDFICSGLQLINFWQDSSVDLKRNRIYYPLSELKQVGLKEKELLSLKDSPQARLLVEKAVDFTENYFRKGHPLLHSVGGRLQLELKATYLGGQGILNKIRGMDYNVLRNRPSWSGMDKLSLALRALFGPVKP